MKHIRSPDLSLVMLGILAMLAVMIGFVLTSKHVRPLVIGYLRRGEISKRRRLEKLGWMVGEETAEDWLERM